MSKEKFEPEVSIVVPLYNEQEVFDELINRLTSILDELDIKVEVVLVNDGSADNTPLLMQKIAMEDFRFKSVFLSRNFGHQYALSAGLYHARGTEAVFIIDGDLQDPPELLKEFYDKLKEGYDVVYAIRQKRKESLFKRLSYKIYYRILSSISYSKIPVDSGDFSMISRKVVDILNSMPEESRYIRGMRSWIGFKQVGYPYERSSRFAGEAKYSFKRLVALAFMGIFNFSEFPIRFITRIGLVTVIVSIFYLIYNIIKKFYFGGVPEGYTSLLFTIILFSGVQLLSIGVIGEYILKIFFDSKKRPLWIVDYVIEDKIKS